MKIYTKTGDRGITSLFGGKRVLKSDLRLECYGTVDELNAALGVVLNHTGSEFCQKLIEDIQKNLFVLGSELASSEGNLSSNLKLISEDSISSLEKTMDTIGKELPPLKNFILPGGSPLATHLHLARTICRRAERATVRLGQVETIRPEIIKYLNRLADLLFMVARQANHKLGKKEILWRIDADS
ncbi:MAG: cob(I)yrinic acid a,c-diamide adenosyltransferase [Patescibacteria group bacterium]